MTQVDIFVIDTNTLLSALILPGSTPDQAFRKAEETGRLAFSADTLAELQNVVIRPKFERYVSLSKRLDFLDRLIRVAVHTPIIHTITDCRDPKDNKFLELALSAAATALISGDSDLLVLHPFRGIPVLSPADFSKTF
jgi:uncharacterized protein